MSQAAVILQSLSPLRSTRGGARFHSGSCARVWTAFVLFQLRRFGGLFRSAFLSLQSKEVCGERARVAQDLFLELAEFLSNNEAFSIEPDKGNARRASFPVQLSKSQNPVLEPLLERLHSSLHRQIRNSVESLIVSRSI